MKLDPTKTYGTINGATDGRRYEQGGRYFDAELNELTAVDFGSVQFHSPRERTKEEKAQYEKDVAAAAALLAAKK